jgi:hypothetical protein
MMAMPAVCKPPELGLKRMSVRPVLRLHAHCNVPGILESLVAEVATPSSFVLAIQIHLDPIVVSHP